MYLLNSAVITNPGIYSYKLINVRKAELLLEAHPWISTIRYPETAQALSLLTGICIPTNSTIIKMEEGDLAIVFRLVFPKGHNRIPTDQKGNLSTEFVLKNHELGLLKRMVAR